MPDVDLKTSTGRSQDDKKFSFSLRRFASAIFLASIPLAVFCQYGSVGICGGVLMATGLFVLTLRPENLTVGLVASYVFCMVCFTLPALLLVTAAGGVHPDPYPQMGVQAPVLAATVGWVFCAYRQRFPGGRKL